MMHDFDSLYRFVFIAAALALIAVERVPALQYRAVDGTRRWVSNVGLFLIGSVVGGLVLPIGLYALAEHQAPGVMTRLGVPLVVQVPLTFLFLDLWKYGEHRLLHGVTWLWRAHLVHHSDTAVDVTTAERHHPLEVALSTALMVALVVALGLPPLGLAVYLLTATVIALYSHANVRLPGLLERALSPMLVTASVHAVHHSSLRSETDSNYGAVLCVWDRLFGTYVHPSRARLPYVGLEYFHAPADTGLWRVLQQPFRFRRDGAYPARVATVPVASDASGPALSASARRVWLAALAGVALVVAATWPTMLDLTRVWSASEAYQYAWLVLPAFGYFVAQQDLRRLEPRPGLGGIALVAVGAAAWAAGTLVNIDALRVMAFVAMLHGVALAALGGPAYGRHFAVLALLLFMIPCGDFVQPALRALARDSIEVFASLAGLPHAIDGFVAHVGRNRYIVVDECSGLTYVTAATFLGYCFALLLRRSFVRAVAFALLGAAIGIACNAVRINAIVLVDWMRGSQMDLAAHGMMQWLMMFATLGTLTYVYARARPSPAGDDVTRDERPGADARWSLAPLAAGAVGLCIAGTFALTVAREAILDPPSAAPVPRELVGWTLASAPSEDVGGSGRNTRSLRATYVRADRELDVLVVEALAHDAKLPESALVPRAPGTWRAKDSEAAVACAKGDCMRVRHATWQRQRSDETRHTYFMYDVAGGVTSSRLVARLRQGWSRLRGASPDARLVAIESSAALEPAEVAQGLRALHFAWSGLDEQRTAGVREARGSIAPR